MINESLVAKQGTLATIETPPQMLVGKLRHFTPTGGTFRGNPLLIKNGS